MSHGVDLNDHKLYNGTSTASKIANTVSWQSALWPLITCMLAVMLQNTGRVCGAHYNDSYALRSSPLICIVDTFFMIAKFFALLALRCPVRVAAMHVWYDRFEHEEGGCQDTYQLVGRVWRSKRLHRRVASISIRADGVENSDLYMCSSALAEELRKIKQSAEHEIDIQVRATTKISTPIQNDPSSSSTAPQPKRKLGVHECDSNEGMNIGILSIRAAIAIPSNVQPDILHEDDEDIEHGSAASESFDDLPCVPSARPSRFYSGSGIDRAWRLNVAGFIFGTLPQAIKILGMQGIPITQTLVAFFLISFLVPEIFRAIAGPAGDVDLQPMPIILRTKSTLVRQQFISLLASCVAGWALCYSYLLSEKIYIDQSSIPTPLSLFTASPVYGALLNVVVTGTIYSIVKSTIKVLRFSRQHADPSGERGRWLEIALMKFKTLVYGLIAFDNSLPEILYLYTVLLPVSLAGYDILVAFWANPAWIAITVDRGSIASFSLLSVPFQILAYYVIYRLLFMGSLSSYPCWLFGIDGRSSEFIAWIVIMFNFLFAYVGYAYRENFSYDTFKPSWAEYLG